ncbi:serine carboxypeptidase-like 45 [Cryptomeria japonica]|uniref:serine carboxypeptidase-like 45 n=1 Tax=Cryptomeria japonica TaxID=3369 RepID=UPI0027DA41DC|nr:serine carboxypeptidase-like 45 [Cryptomeria japonica]
MWVSQQKNAGAIVVFLLIRLLLIEAYENDLITGLPGQPAVPFKQYAGYVTVDRNYDRALFYYFVEAEKNPSSKPLVLWLNGGPGCSSLGVGAFSENGPFQPSKTILVQNDYSWNKEANVLYLESPAGVGFSYSNTTSFYEGVNDRRTALDNLVFFIRWFKKFPAYKTRDLYLTGESYAGHYIPQLAERMLRYNRKYKIFNLKGVAIGNPLMKFGNDLNARAEFLWSHGLICDQSYKEMVYTCNYSRYVHEFYRHNLSAACNEVNSLISQEVSDFIDNYDVTLDVCLSSIGMQSKTLNSMLFQRKNEENPQLPDVCVGDESTTYLNRLDVQEAMNIRLTGAAKQWSPCSRKLHYDHLNLEISTVHLLGELVKAGIRVFVYSGDQDSVIPLTGTRTLIYNLAAELKLNTSAPYRVWFEGNQVGGWTQVYSNSLSYATVRGGSHEVPFSQPERSLVLFKSFLKGEPLPYIK